MNELETVIADMFDVAIDSYEAARPRTRQQIIGVSELGTCHEQTRRKLLQLERTDVSKANRAAFIGTAVGDVVEEAVEEHLGGPVWRQIEVGVDLPSGRWHLVGHVDIVLPFFRSDADEEARLLVVDVKTKDGYEAIRRDGPTDQNHMQRDLYALGIWQMLQRGEAPPGVDADAVAALSRQPVDDYLVANAYIDRSGQEPKTLVSAEPFSWEWVYAAETFLDDAVYAAEHGEEASKDKPRNWCESFCEFYSGCRLLDTDVGGLITNQEAARAVGLYAEGQALEREAKRMKEQAKAQLAGVTGNTATHSVRWITKNATWIEGHMRKESQQIEVRALKTGDQ